MLSSESNYDAVIVGGGIVGAATAYELARQQRQVLLVDQFEPGHTHGSSHGDGRIIRLAYPEPIYLEMARLAYAGWANLAAQAGEPFVQKTGGWDCGPAGCLQLDELAANFRRHGIPYERLSAAESNRRFPYFHLNEGSEAIYQADYGVVFAAPAVKALWRLAQIAGAVMLSGVRIERITPQGGQLRLAGSDGQQWTTPRLLLAAGGWSRSLAGLLDLDLPLTVTQEQVAYFASTGLSHRAGKMPVMIDYHGDSPFYALPQIEIGGVKVGWHHTGQVVDPDQPQPIDAENLAGVQAFVQQRFPHLDSTSPFGVTRCLYTSTPDHHFILDRHPDLPQVVIAAGFSGHGFKFGPLLGQIVAALLLGEAPPVALDQFALARFADPASLQPRSGA